MNLADTLRALIRRWYITVPGILIAVATAIGVWIAVPPGYERTAMQLLLPGEQSMPESSNPLLYLGGLSNAADVLVRAVGSENVLLEIEDDYPGVEVKVERDASTAGPVILITVTASSDAQAIAALDALVAKTSVVLEDLQQNERIAQANRISVVPITVDTESVLRERDRLVLVVVAGVAVAGVALLLAGFVDGIARQRRRRPEGGGEDVESEPDGDAAADVEILTSIPPESASPPTRVGGDVHEPGDDSPAVSAATHRRLR